MPRLLLTLLLTTLGVTATRANDVWVDFISDFHDGANGPSNGVADWIDELNQATAEAGVPTFNETERAEIESRIFADLETIFAGYELNFVATRPLGEHDVVYMARDNDHPDVSSSNFGSAPVDLGNQDTDTYRNFNGNPSGVPKVTTGNFDGNLESSDTRARQIEELSTALAGTTAHELGHSFGLLHHFVYSQVDISPSNYANTGSLQNVHILATGGTGISETERERLRSLSPFSRVMMDLTGGSQASSFEENNSLVANPIFSDRSELGSADNGDTLATAAALSFEIGQTSGLPISFVEADLDGSPSDADLYSFSVATDAVLVSHVFSERLDLGSNEFDPILQLIDADGQVITSVDDTTWDDDQFVDLSSPEDEDDDSFLVNIPLTPGDYFLRVLPTTVDSSDSPNPGDRYWLVTSLDLAGPALPGNYNGDGLVDAADYTVWRDADGAAGTLPFDGADGDGNGLVDAGDYAVWADNYGAAVTPSPVPEPGGVLLLVAAAVARKPRR